MCVFNSPKVPKPPPAPVIPPPPPAPDANSQLAPLTGPKAAARKPAATLGSFRRDLTIQGGYSGLNIPR